MNYLTADKARDITEQNMIIATHMKDFIMNNIRKCAEQGKSCFLIDRAENLQHYKNSIIQWLTDLGYEINTDGSDIMISW
jgi:hypothetical protein